MSNCETLWDIYQSSPPHSYSEKKIGNFQLCSVFNKILLLDLQQSLKLIRCQTVEYSIQNILFKKPSAEK